MTWLLAGALRQAWYACATYTNETGTERPCINPIRRARAQALPLPCAPSCFVNLLSLRVVCSLALAFACALSGEAGQSIEGITRTMEGGGGLDE